MFNKIKSEISLDYWKKLRIYTIKLIKNKDYQFKINNIFATPSKNTKNNKIFNNNTEK